MVADEENPSRASQYERMWEVTLVETKKETATYKRQA